VIDTLESFVENYRSSQFFGATFFHGKGYKLILTKKGDGIHFARFLTNKSGHPGLHQRKTIKQLFTVRLTESKSDLF
jgi:hypothetical protein